MANRSFSILGISGSLRAGSYNTAALRAAQQLAPDGVRIELFDLEGIPPYNQDAENDPPLRVRELKAAVRAADALLFCSPEYNYSIPGVLKNAIDSASRPYGDNAFDGKPVAMMGATIGTLGTARAQYHLRQSCIFLNMYPLNQPEVMVAQAQNKIDADGRLTDDETRRRIGDLLAALVAWARRLRS